MKRALVLHGATDFDSPGFSGDILWRTRFHAPDPVVLVEIEGRTLLFVSSLEVGRAVAEADVDEVVSQEAYLDRAEGHTFENGLVLFLQERGITHIVVPDAMQYAVAKALERAFRVTMCRPPFYPGRARKTEWEIGEIKKAQRAVELAVRHAMDFLGRCEIRGDRFYGPAYSGPAVTAGMVRRIIDHALYRDGFLGVGTIVACGVDAADPHNRGSGLLKPYAPIVLDIFPVSKDTHYYADMTRTVFKGEPSMEFKRMYETVRAAQEGAINRIKDGVDGFSIQEWVWQFFAAHGYPTCLTGNEPEGFIHGVGHGVGISMHEPPVISTRHDILEEGHVVTVEPGLYYKKARDSIPAGGVRIEDMVVVEKDGCSNLTQFPKGLQDMVIS